MKSIYLCSFILFLFPSVRADVIIDSTTLNGSFESPGGDASPDTTFSPWTTGLNVVENQRREDNASAGNWSLVIGTSTEGNDLGALINTGYLVQAGDIFTLSFDWAEAYQWDTADRVDWRLFTTDDNTAAGTLTQVAAGYETTNSLNTLTYQSANSPGVGTVVAANEGQELWLEIYSSNTDSNEFGRVDNVQLIVIPESSSLMLTLTAALGLAGWGCLRQRRV